MPPETRVAARLEHEMADAEQVKHAAEAYRSSGFVETEPYPESEIPDRYKPHWLFMELRPT
jgi:hypothetical protein